MISTAIQQLVNYGLDTGLILPDDEIYIRNQLLMTMQLDDFTAREAKRATPTWKAFSRLWWTMPLPAACARIIPPHAICSTPS